MIRAPLVRNISMLVAYSYREDGQGGIIMRRGKQWLLCMVTGLGSLGMLFLFFVVYVCGQGTEQEGVPGEEEHVFFENAYLLSYGEEGLALAHREGEFVYKLGEGEYEALKESIRKGTVADVTVEDGQVTDLVLKNQRIVAEEWSYTENGVQLGEQTEYPLARAFVAYDGPDGRLLTKEQLHAYKNVVFYITEGEVCAAIADTSVVPMIRVLITRDAGSSIRQKITVTADEEYQVKNREGETKTISAGESYSLAVDAKAVDEVWTLTTDGAFSILGGQGDSGVTYPRCLEIFAMEDGLYVVNELSLEDYLYGVLPGEIPGSYEEEAQKAQAVCARTYAYGALTGYRYEEVRAHLDDTTNCQVYNASVPTEEAIRAVNETCGYILTMDGRTATTYYYSTSYGVGAAAEEIWNDTGREYLVTKLHSGFSDSSEVVKSLLTTTNREELLAGIDLSEEEVFRNFLTESRVRMSLASITIEETVNTYDADYAWYRWSMETEAEAFSKMVLSNLKGLSASMANNVVYSNEDKSLGELTEITVTKRGKSGVVTELVLTGTEGSVTLKKQTVIRNAFAPKEQTIVRGDGKEITGMSLLPSAYFYVDMENDRITMQGGGYGHGVGMSQNGANAMAEEGNTYRDILEHYFGGTEQTRVYGK